MTYLLSVVSDVAILAAVVSGQYLLALIFRSPYRPNWLDFEECAILTAVLITTALALAFSGITNSLIDVGLDFWSALGIALACLVTVSILLWEALHMGARLKACENGLSPFAFHDRGPVDPAGAGLIGGAPSGQ